MMSDISSIFLLLRLLCFSASNDERFADFSFFSGLVTSYKRFNNNYVVRLCSNLIYPFPNKPWFLLVCSTCLLKTL